MAKSPSLKQMQKWRQEWKVRAVYRRKKLTFYRKQSKRPAAEKAKLIKKWADLTSQAERRVDYWNDRIAKADPGRQRAKELYHECLRISNQGRAYVYGGGHTNFHNINSWQGLDCSSSSSYALWNAKLFAIDHAIVSGQFGNYFQAGRGRFVTIWYNPKHCWIQFHGLGKYFRFDTSPWGSGGRGPRMRVGPRPSTGFKACHPKGL
jgi:hypothetical protein